MGEKCYLCQLSKAQQTRIAGTAHVVDCKVCGHYQIGQMLARTIESGSLIDDAHLISGHVREQTELLSNSPDIDSTPVYLPDREACAAVAASAPRRIRDKARKVLEALSRRTRHFGDCPRLLSATDYPLGYAKNEEEFRHLVGYLADLELVKSVGWDNDHEGTYSCPKITAKGFEALEHPNSRSDKSFVAMSFSKDLRHVYEEAIAPGIRKARFRPIRVDDIEHTDMIDDRIIAELREARFAVADFTEHKHGVYFEAGFALGLGIPVIWVCREDEIDRAHFDTRQFNHITWKAHDLAKLRTDLTIRIRAVIGLGPNAGIA